jgi:hypothetical protein
MRYRDVDYTIVQGQGRQLWKWGFAVHNEPHTGEARNEAQAVSEAERDRPRVVSENCEWFDRSPNANRGWPDAICEPPSVNSHLKRAGNLQSLASEARWTAR